MSAEVPNQTNINKGSSFRARRLIDQWPLLVWAAMLGLVLYLYSQRGVNIRVNGMIAAHNEEISATEDGVILEVLVKEGDKVAKGQELVKLNNHDIMIEGGFGIDFYLQYFKFSPQIKISHGIINILSRDKTVYTQTINNLKTSGWMLSFTFE